MARPISQRGAGLCRWLPPGLCPGLATCARGGTTAEQTGTRGKTQLGSSQNWKSQWDLEVSNKKINYSVTNGVTGHVPFRGTKNLTFFTQKDQEKTVLSVVQAKKVLWTRYCLGICLRNLWNKSHITESRKEFMWNLWGSFSLFLDSRKEIKLYKA